MRFKLWTRPRPEQALFSPPERSLHRTDSTDKKDDRSVVRHVICGAVLGAVSVASLAPTVQAVSEVWQGRDQFVELGGRKP